MSSTNTTGAAGAAEGGNAADSLGSAVKQGFGFTENLRQGVNNFFDKSIQPSAARDADAGVTARHRDAHPFSTSSTSGAGSGATTASESGLNGGSTGTGAGTY